MRRGGGLWWSLTEFQYLRFRLRKTYLPGARAGTVHEGRINRVVFWKQCEKMGMADKVLGAAARPEKVWKPPPYLGFSTRKVISSLTEFFHERWLEWKLGWRGLRREVRRWASQIWRNLL